MFVVVWCIYSSGSILLLSVRSKLLKMCRKIKLKTKYNLR